MKYAAKKIGLMLLTMVIVSFLAFLAFQVIPGDPAVKLLGTEATPERIAAAAAELETGVVSARNLEKKQKCVFLDRDGTVNRYRGNGTGPSVPGAVRSVGAGGPARGLRHIVQL